MGRTRRDKLESGINRYTLLYIKEVTNKDLLYSTGNYTILSILLFRATPVAYGSSQVKDQIGGTAAGTSAPTAMGDLSQHLFPIP